MTEFHVSQLALLCCGLLVAAAAMASSRRWGLAPIRGKDGTNRSR